jgi:prepilin-type N-terminal cleavage/methylation domain-containing protein
MFFKDTLRGFSLVELLVYITIFSIVSASIWQAFIWFQKNHINFTQQQQASFDIDHIYDLLNKDISISGLNDLPDNNTNCLHISGLKITYSFEGGNLYRYFDEEGVCSPPDNSLKPLLAKNIMIDSDNFFIIESKSKYKTITYSFKIQLDNKTICCNTTRQVFSGIL